MGYLEAIDLWRALPDATRCRLRWQAIPQQVADSLAFEGEPVELAWLTILQPLHLVASLFKVAARLS